MIEFEWKDVSVAGAMFKKTHNATHGVYTLIALQYGNPLLWHWEVEITKLEGVVADGYCPSNTVEEAKATAEAVVEMLVAYAPANPDKVYNED